MATSKKTSPAVAAASHACTEAMAGAGSWDRARETLVAALGECRSAADVEAVLRAGGISELVFDEVPMPDEVADVIVERALAMPPKEGAKTLGWLVVLEAVSPATLVARRSFEEGARRVGRPGGAAGIDRHVDRFRAWSRDASVDRRIAGAHLLAWCASAGEEDARALLAAVPAEKNAAALATLLLTLGVIASRHAQPRDAVRAIATAKLAHPDARVGLCAAIALALLGDVLGSDATRAVVEHLVSPVKLPAQWGWHCGSGTLDSGAAAAAVVAWLATDAPEAAIRALSAVRFDLTTPIQQVRTRAARFAIASTVFRLAFDARGLAVPRQGIAASELDELQRTALETIGRLAAPIRALEMREEDVGPFLERAEPHWREIVIEAGGRTHRWHFARLLGAVAIGEVSPVAARDAVLRFPDGDAADLASRWSSGRVLLDARITAPEERRRMLDLCVAILAALRARGFDLHALCRGAVDDRSRSSLDVGILTIGWLRLHRGAELDDDLVPLAARAAEQGWWADDLLAELRQLPARSRRTIAYAIEANVHALPFLALELDGEIARKLVLRWRQDPAPVVELLARGDEEIASALESMQAPNDVVRQRVAPIVARVIAAIRAKR